MVSIAAQINTQRRPISYYAPRPAPRYAPAQPPPRPTYPIGGSPAPRAPDGGVDWSAVTRAFAAPGAGPGQAAPPEPEQPGGFFGSPIGRGLGFIINNPVTKVITAPFMALDVGRKAAILGVEEAAEALPGAPEWLRATIGATGAGNFFRAIDTERTEADTRSNWAKLSPTSDYGFGQLIPKDVYPKWVERGIGLAGDVAFDPLTYLTGGASRVVAVSHASEALKDLKKATNALKVARESGDAERIARATERLTQAENYVVRAPSMGQKISELPMPRNRAERVNLLSQLTETPEGRHFLQQMPGEAQRAGTRGFQVISPEAKTLLGIQEPGLRIRGIGAKLPGTGKIADVINRTGGATRAGIARLPGATGARLNYRVPKGLLDAYNVLSRDVEGDVFRSASKVWTRNEIRLGTGAQLARGNRALVKGVKEFFKGQSKPAIRQMVRDAETVAEPNGVNEIAARLLGIYQRVTDRVIDPAFLRNPDTYFPHLLDPHFRRYLARVKKQGSEAADDFMRHAGFVEDDLLEQPAFYADNLLEGSGFLEKARKYGLDKDGNPQTFKIGDTEVTFTADDLDHINEQLTKAFPNYKGDFYDTDPVRVLEAYNTSLARQAGRDIAARRAFEVGNPLVRTMTGELDATRRAINEALAQQGPAPILSTAQGRYDPTKPLPTIPERPVVPGSYEERAPIEALRKSAAEQTDPGTAAVLNEEADRLEAALPRIGGIEPKDYFVTTAGTEATGQQRAAVTRARTYARAAAAETRAAEKTLRERIAELKEIIVSPLKTSIKQMDGEIKALNKKVKEWGKTIKDMGDLSPDNLDEMTVVLVKVEEALANAEMKLKRTAASWKGRATRQQRQAEARLRNELEELRKVRDATRAKVEAAPPAMREELLARERILNQEVRDANEALLRAEMEIPVPHNQLTVEDSFNILRQKLAEGEDPGVLLGRYRSIIEEHIRRKPSAIVAASVTDTPAMAHERQVYAQLLDEVAAIQARTRGGKLSEANQRLLDEATAKLTLLENALKRGETVGGVAARMNPYDEAVNRLSDLRTTVIPNAAPAELPALRAERDRLARMFRPGGRHYEEQQARDVLKDMVKYDKEVAFRTQTERAALDLAEKRRKAKQESIVWAQEAQAGVPAVQRLRYMTAIGEDPSNLEGMGWGLGQKRFPEEVTNPPEGVAAWLTKGRAAPTGELRGVPPPRTEVEALTSLRSQVELGSQRQMGARAEARAAQETLTSREASFPEELAEKQDEIAQLVRMDSERELGPLKERVETYTNLATDLADRRNLVAKRQEARDLRDRVKPNPTNPRTDIDQTLNDLEAVAKDNPLLDDEKMNQVESLLYSHRIEAERVDETKMRVRDLDRVVKDAEDGNLGPVMVASLNNNWRALHGGRLPNTGDLIMDAELYRHFTNLFEINRQPKVLGRLFNAFTNLFKTYATLSPGFFVRNTIGGIFMNTADGVSLARQLEGALLWQKWMKQGDDWLLEQPRSVQEAFAATFASGAGGRFEESGVLARTESALYNFLSANRATKWAQRTGTRVEGGMRLGMALDSIEKGMEVQGALQRITRVHFDYTQVSEIDEMMKRIIPFWTFMSRNLPLQIQEMWTNPRVYAYYQSVVRNFSEPDEDFTPDYWLRQGAWRTPVSVAGAPLYAQPDLGFTRVQSDVQMLSDALSGQNFGLLFSQANPILGATADFAFKKDSFYNRTYGPEDYKKLSGPIGAPITLIAKALGQTNEANQVSENFTNYLTSLAPPLNQATRLLPEAAGGDSNLQTWAKRARYIGAPIQLLTPDAQNSEYWRQWRAMQDENARLRAMMMEEQAAAGG